MNRYFIAFGANIGEIQDNFKKAAKLIASNIGNITLKSSLYSSQALTLDSKEKQSDYINCVICVESEKNEKEVLAELNSIEKLLGRQRIRKWDSRVIDLDIIANGQKYFKSEALEVPHKQMHKRTFVLYPMLEIEPDWIHPVLKKSITEMVNDLNEKTPCETLKSFPDYEF